jgi:PAS domain S-box-containing protein
MKLGFKLTSIFLIFTLSTAMFFYIIGLWNQGNNFKLMARDHISRVRTTFHNLEERDMHMLSSALEAIIHDSRLKKVYLQKNRGLLWNYVQPLFQELKDKHGITHFYFILPDGHVFLRVHNRGLYGDLVKRKSFRKARDTKGPAWELELGKTAFALRSVMPYYHAGTLIGYVELGEEIHHFLRILKEETNSEFSLIGNKIYLDRNDWRSTRQVAGLRDNWDDLEKHLIISSTSEGEMAAKCFIEDNVEKADKGENVFYQVQGEKRTFLCAGFDLNGNGGQPSGALLALIDITDHAAVDREANKTILHMALILFFITFMAGIIISRSLTRPILELTQIAKAAGKGDLSQDMSIDTNDEIGQLQETFKTMLELRKQTEEELRRAHDSLEARVRERTADLIKTTESLRLFRYLIDQSNDAIFVIEPETGRYLDVNERACDLLGYTREEMLNLRVSDITLNVQDQTVWMELSKKYREAGQMSFEREIKRKNGTTLFAEVNGKFVQQAGASYIVAIARDVTERKLAEAERARLVLAVESAADAVVITDTRGIIQYVNPSFEKITGYARDESVGRDLHFLDSGKHDEVFYRQMREQLHLHGVWTGRLINKKKDGTLYEEECTYSSVSDPFGKVINYISIKRDMTEKIRLESIAQTVDSLNNIGYIFSGVRHEIGNPVNSIKLIVGLIEKKLDTLSREDIKRHMGATTAELSKIEYLLKSLRNFNMYEQLELHTVKVPLFMEKFLPLVKEAFEKKGIVIESSLDPNAARMHVDTRALQQVLLNIMVNASDALEGRQDPKISIGIHKQGEMVRLRIEDNGCGIPENKVSDLFKPFYTTKAHGTGLGLVIAKKMLTMMNGTIEISSRKDVGTVVAITVPEGRDEGKNGET